MIITLKADLKYITVADVIAYDSGGSETDSDYKIYNYLYTFIYLKEGINLNTYKFSMFAKPIYYENGDMVLYSSYLGINKVVKIRPENINKVKYWIEESIVTDNNDDTLKRLIDAGYFVSTDVDEKLLRQDLINSTLYCNDLTLVIHTTEACNFRCEYCALDFNPRNLSPEVSNSIIQYIRKNISKYSSVIISWFGGEPLLNMGEIERISKEVISICKIARKPFYASVTTNGYLLTKQNIEKLYDCHVRNICVTVDGYKDIHDKHRHLANGEPTYEVIMENLRYIRDCKRIHMAVNIRTNVSVDTFDKLPEYCEYIDSEFGNDKRFSMFFRLVSDWGGERIKNMKDSLLDVSAYNKIFEIYQTHTHNVKINMNMLDFEPAGFVCPAMMKNKYTISVDGKICKCDTPTMYIGVLKNDGVMDIDEKTHCKWVLSGRYAQQRCDDCFFSCSCFMGTCPKNMIINKNNYDCQGIFNGLIDILKCYIERNTVVTI